MDTGSNQDNDSKPEDAESSGLADILEVAEALGDENDDVFGSRSSQDDDLDSVGPSKGATAALVGGDEAAAAPKAAPKPPPPPPTKAAPPPPPPPPPPPEKKKAPEPVAADPESELAKVEAELAKAEAATKLAEAQAKLAEAQAKLAEAQAKKRAATGVTAAVSQAIDDDPLGALLKPPSKEEEKAQRELERVKAEAKAEEDPLGALLAPPDDDEDDEADSGAVVVAPLASASASAASSLFDDGSASNKKKPAAASTAAASTAAVLGAPAKEEGNNKLWIILLAVLLLGGGITWWVIQGQKPDEPTKIVEAKVVEPPPPEPEPEPVPEPEPEPEPVIVDASTGGTETDTDGTDTGGSTGEPKDEGDDFGGSRTVARAKKPATKKTKDVDPYAEDDGGSDPFDAGKANCVFNPNAPGCKGASGGSSLKDLDATLPDKLSESAVRKALSKSKNKAKSQCGAQHGAESGEIVRVKLSIEGNSGEVIEAEPIAPHNNALGECVADVLRKAKFPRFTSPQQGTTFPVTF